MRSLNEHLARRANEEDNCTGHFWESRFKSQALLDEGAVLAYMSYADNINPVHVKKADTPEASDFTSIQQRIRELAPSKTTLADETPTTPIPLMKLVSQPQDPHPNSIGFTLTDYLELVEWAGREIREGKRGSINDAAPPILERLNLDHYRLMEHLRGEAIIEKPVMLCPVEKIKYALTTTERICVKVLCEARRLFRHPIYT